MAGDYDVLDDKNRRQLGKINPSPMAPFSFFFGNQLVDKYPQESNCGQDDIQSQEILQGSGITNRHADQPKHDQEKKIIENSPTFSGLNLVLVAIRTDEFEPHVII